MISSVDFIAQIKEAFQGKINIYLSPANASADQATGIQLDSLNNDNNDAASPLDLSPENGYISNDELNSAVNWLKAVANPAEPKEQETIGTLETFVQARADISKLLKDLELSEVPFDDQQSGLFTTGGSQVGEIQGGRNASQGEVMDSVMDAVSEEWVADKGPAPDPASFSRQSKLISDARMESMIGALDKTIGDNKKLYSEIKNELNKDTLGKLYTAVQGRDIESSDKQSLRVADFADMLKIADIPDPDVTVNDKPVDKVKSAILGYGTLTVSSGKEVLAVIRYNPKTNSIEGKGVIELLEQLGKRLDKLIKTQPVFQEAAKQLDTVESFVDIRWADPFEDPTTTESTDPPSTDPEQPGSTDPDPSGLGGGTSNPQNEQGG